MIGNTKIDLSNCYTKAEVDALLQGKSNTDHTHTAYATTQALSTLESTISNNYTLKTTTSGIDTRVGTLETAKTNHEGRIATLETTGGKEGPQGPAGAAAGFGTMTGSVTMGNATTLPAVSVTTSGDNTAKNFNFAFTLPKAATFSYSGTTLTITTN